MKQSPPSSRAQARTHVDECEPASPGQTSLSERLDACAFIAIELAQGTRYFQTRPRPTHADVSARLGLLQKGFATIAAHITAIRLHLPADYLQTDCPTPAPSAVAEAQRSVRERLGRKV